MILHVDMDAFFASVEARDNPAYRGQPLVVGALPGQRGVVSTASYEARKFGVRSAMPIAEAYRRCPQAIYVKPRIDRYHAVSQDLHKIWCSYTDRVEFLSLDEAYLDLTDLALTWDQAVELARGIKDRTKETLGLTCSLGLAYSKAAAKLASEEKKPDGLFVIQDVQAWLDLVIDRPVSILYGVGRVTTEQLGQLGIFTVRDLLAQAGLVKLHFKDRGQEMLDLARGQDLRQVVPYFESEAKSLGKERTLQEDSRDRDLLLSLVRLYARDLSQELTAAGLLARTVTLKITWANMQAITRSKTIPPTNQASDLFATGQALFQQVSLVQPVRLIGLAASNFTDQAYQQLSLADLSASSQAQAAKQAKLQSALSDISEKFGHRLVETAAELEARQKVEGKRKPPTEDSFKRKPPPEDSSKRKPPTEDNFN